MVFLDPVKRQMFRDASGQIFSLILRPCHMHIYKDDSLHLLGTLMCIRAEKRRKREGTMKMDSNPVYATYQADYDPVAEVIVN